MDSRSFDSLARRFAARATRRSLVGAAVAGIAGAGLVADETSAAARTCRLAAQKCVRDNQCCSGTCAAATRRSRIRHCACTAAQTDCNGACADVDTDRNHCGACNRACGAGFDCVDGACTACTSSDAALCLVTTEGVIVERGHTCVEGEPSDCTSSAACAALAGKISDGMAAACVTELWVDGVDQGISPDNHGCVVYATGGTC